MNGNNLSGNYLNGNMPEKRRNAGKMAIGTLLILMLLGFLTFSLAAAPVSAELTPKIGYELYQIKLSDWAGYPDYVKYSRYDKIYELCLYDKAGSSVKSRSWSVDDPYWTSSSKEKFSVIYTPDDVDKMKGKVKVKLVNIGSGGDYGEAEEYIYLTEAASWGNFVIYDLTPEPTATPTPVPTPTPTPEPTPEPTQTPEPTPAASHVYKLPISSEMTKLQDTFSCYIELIKKLFGIK